MLEEKASNCLDKKNWKWQPYIHNSGAVIYYSLRWLPFLLSWLSAFFLHEMLFSFVFGIVANATLQYFFVLYPLIHCLTLSTSKCRNFALTICISLYTVQGCYLIACSWCWLSFDNLAFYAASVDSTAQTGHPGAGDLQEELYQMVKRATIPLALLLAYFHLYRYDFHFLFPRNSFYCFLLVCSFAKQPSLFSLFF